MTYAMIDDNMPDHPKVARLSDRAFRLYVSSICFCARNLTDGLILRSQARRVGADPDLIRELVAARLWDAVPDGWQVHDYLEWNKSRADVLAFREQQRKRAAKRWRSADCTAAGIPPALPTALPVVMPTAIPVAMPSETETYTNSYPIQSDQQQQPRARAEEVGSGRGSWLKVYEDTFGLIPAGIIDEVREYSQSVPSDWWADAFAEGRAANARSWAYVRRVLDRWMQQGRNGRQSRDAVPSEPDYFDGKYGQILKRRMEAAR
jgi:hypothetical protein